MDLDALEALLKARFAEFVTEYTPTLESHPRELADAPEPGESPGSWAALVERGALELLAPRAEGGLDLGHAAAAVVAELMGAAGFPAACYLDTLLGLELLRRCDHSEKVPPLIRDVMAGRHRIAVAYRGTGAHQAPDGLPPWSSVTEDGDTLVVSARRSFVTGADVVDTLLVLGEDSPTLVLLPMSDPSVLVEERSTLGQRRLFDVDVHEARIQAAGAFELGADPAAVWACALGRARIWQAAYLTGLAAGALDAAVGYAKNRRQFGRPLAQFQSIGFRLAASSARVRAARLLTRDVALAADRGDDIRSSAAQALAFAAEVGRATTAEAVHVHGAFGMTLQSTAQRFFRDAGAESVWLGTVPELRRQVGQHRTAVDPPLRAAR